MMIRSLKQEDIPQLAAIHLENAAAWSHHADMGQQHMEHIYQTILTDPNSFGFGYFKEDTAVSFITATTQYFEIMDRLYRLMGWKQYKILIKQILKKPSEFLDLWESKFVIPRLMKEWKITSFLLTWHNNFSENDTAMAAVFCMQRTLTELKQRGCHVCTVQVDAHNEKPNAYYRSMKAPLKFSSKHNNIYEIALSP